MVFIRKECTVRRFYEASKFHNSTGQKFVDLKFKLELINETARKEPHRGCIPNILYLSSWKIKEAKH